MKNIIDQIAGDRKTSKNGDDFEVKFVQTPLINAPKLSNRKLKALFLANLQRAYLFKISSAMSGLYIFIK